MTNPLFDAALELQNFIHKNGWSFCFIGGLSVIRWGQIRATQDVDISLLSGFGNETIFIESFKKSFKSRVKDLNEFAKDT